MESSYPWINHGWVSIDFNVILFDSSLQRHKDTKCFSSSESSRCLNHVRLLETICWSFSKGISPQTISYRRTPKLHTVKLSARYRLKCRWVTITIVANHKWYKPWGNPLRRRVYAGSFKLKENSVVEKFSWSKIYQSDSTGIFVNENVLVFYITVKNTSLVTLFDSFQKLSENFPEIFLEWWLFSFPAINTWRDFHSRCLSLRWSHTNPYS